MKLTQRIGKMGKVLGLGLALASPVYNPGCNNLVGSLVEGALIKKGLENAAETNAKATREASAGKGMQNYNQENKFFTYKYWKGDLNRNGLWDSEEFVGYNDGEYSKLFSVGAIIYNHEDETANIEVRGANNKRICNSPIKIPGNIGFVSVELFPGNFENEGRYLAILKINDQIFAEKAFYVKK